MINLPPPAPRRAADGRSMQDAAAGVGVSIPDLAVLALQQGRVIEAIKLIRGANPGLDLARAKAAMERLQAQARLQSTDDDDEGATSMPSSSLRLTVQGARRPPTVAMGDPPGQLRWLLVVVVLLVAAAWFAFGGA